VRAIDPDPEDVLRLTEWRNLHRRSFLTEFDATAGRTQAWLKQSLAVDDSRIMFMVSPEEMDPIGFVGLVGIDWGAGYGELDNVVRGEPSHPGAMSRASLGLLAWARQVLGLAQFGVRVLADNPAVTFYEKLGFREFRRAPLRRSLVDDGVRWEVAHDSPIGLDTRWLSYMAFSG
jgi:RimJ/RimL family protein N-acetyltransferase